MNYIFRNPLATNDLFRPILQLLVSKNKINYKNLINDISKLIMDSYNSSSSENSSFINIENILIQVELKLYEAIDYLVFNNIINTTRSINNTEYELTEIGKLHIQTEEPIKFYDQERNLRYILDFLP